MRSKIPNPYTYNFKCKQKYLNCQNAIPPTPYFRKHWHGRAINIYHK